MHAECDFNSHECNFHTHEFDFAPISVIMILTSMIWTRKSAISTHSSVILASWVWLNNLTKINVTLQKKNWNWFWIAAAPNTRVWFWYERVWLWHTNMIFKRKMWFHEQSVIFARMSVIYSRSVQFSQAECLFNIYRFDVAPISVITILRSGLDTQKQGLKHCVFLYGDTARYYNRAILRVYSTRKSVDSTRVQNLYFNMINKISPCWQRQQQKQWKSNIL
jgi:hypothetical protein